LRIELIEKFDDHDHFECEALTDIEKTEMKASNRDNHYATRDFLVIIDSMMIST